MTKKNFGKRSSRKRFRPSGGMQAKPLKKSDSEAGREDMENGRILDEPVYDKTHESEILRAENKAAGIKEEPKESASEGAGKSAIPRKKKEESGVVSSVKKFIRKLLPKKPSGTEIIINAESLETRIGIMKNNRLEDFTIERNNVERIVASIYKGKVRNLEDRLEAAFVDIGIEKNAFLHYWDI